MGDSEADKFKEISEIGHCCTAADSEVIQGSTGTDDEPDVREDRLGGLTPPKPPVLLRVLGGV